MRKSYLVFLSFLLFQLHVYSQDNQITVNGTVADESGMPIPGANVIQQGTSNGVVTNFDGEFSIEVPADAILEISYLGYATQEIKVNGQTKFNISLEPETSALDEVVLIGYQSVHREDVTGAVSSIESEDLEGIPVTSVSSLIANQSVGLQSVNLSGAPGARGGLIIRGNTSIGGDIDPYLAFSSPLYVIDGVQTSLEDLAGYGVSNIDFLASLNPFDIKSINILKDAAAAAIYGSRGANGVIIIETKGGKALEEPEFTFSTSIGFQPKPELVPMLVGAAERRAKMGMIQKWWSHDALLSDDVPIMLTDSLNVAFNNNVDYQDLFYQTGISQRYNFSVRGGSEKTNYRVSLGYNDDKGVVKGTGFDRYTLNSNINFKIGNAFDNQFRANASFIDNQTGQGNPYQGSYNLNTILPVNPASLNSSLFYLTEERRKSLKGELNEKLNTDQTFRTTFSNMAKLDLFEGLALNSQLTFTYSSNKKNFYEPSTVRPQGDGFASYALYTRKNLSSDLYLSLFQNFGENHQITAIAGTRVDYNKYEDMALTAVGYGSDAIKVINDRYTTDEINGYTDISENALLSYYGRVSYEYKDRYIIMGNFSLDGSSRFGEDVRWAKFPSISAAWTLSEEPFIKPYVSDWLDFAKIRASWGINGKQFSENYLRYGAYNLGYGGQAYWGNQMNVSSYAGVTGVVPKYDAIGNNKLSWEESEQWNLGFDLTMFNHRLNMSFNAYNKKTDKLFFDITFPAYSGYDNAKANVAGIVNYGWESTVSFDVFPRTNDFRTELTLGLSQNKNFVSKLPNGNRDYIASSYGYVVGRPINLYYMFINDYIIDDLGQLPVNPYTGEPLTGKSAWAAIRPGFPIWKDMNGDYLLNERHDQVLVRKYSPVPEFQGLFNLDIRYKNWYLRAYSQFSFGADIKNTVLNSYLDAYDRGGDAWATNGLADLSQYSFWEKPGDGAAGVRFPALYPQGGGLSPFYSFRGNQTLWIESGDYWKITNASIGHMFRQDSFIEDLGLSRLRVYISVLNPWQWQESETVVDASMVDALGNVLGNGYPQARTYSFGINATF